MPTLAEILSSPALAYQEYQKPLSERMLVGSQERDLIEQLALKYYRDIVQGGALGTYAQQVAAIGSAYSAYDQTIVQQALNTVAIPVPGIGIPTTGSGAGTMTPFEQRVTQLLAAGVPLDQAIQQAMAWAAGTRGNGIGSGSGGRVLLLIGVIALALVLLGGKK